MRVSYKRTDRAVQRHFATSLCFSTEYISPLFMFSQQPHIRSRYLSRPTYLTAREREPHLSVMISVKGGVEGEERKSWWKEEKVFIRKESSVGVGRRGIVNDFGRTVAEGSVRSDERRLNTDGNDEPKSSPSFSDK